MIRTLQDNSDLRWAVGIETYDGIPSPQAFSRFMSKMEWLGPRMAVKNCFRFLVKKMSWQFPEFGNVVAVDSTALRAWSNGRHKIPTDKDAGWCAKTDNAGKTKYTWGYKAHVLCDTATELPFALNLSAGNVYDGSRATPVLYEAYHTLANFRPTYTILDAGYSSFSLWERIRRRLCSRPIIKPQPAHARMREAQAKRVPEWEEVYPRREAVERLFSRLKMHRRFDSITVRGLRRVEAHCYFPLIVMNARALAMPETLRQVVRAA